MFAGLAMAVLPSVVNMVTSSDSQDAASARNDAQIAATQATNAQSVDLADTAYVRKVNDLHNAGLNPMLAYGTGGSVTPSLATPQIEDVMANSVSNGVKAASAITEQVVARAQVANLAADTRLKEAGTVKASEEANVASTQAALNAVGVDKMNSEIGVNNAQTALNKANEQSVLANMQKIAPEIKSMVSQANLNDQQRLTLVQQLPLIAAQTKRTLAETDVAYQDRLIKAVQVQVDNLRVPGEVNKFNYENSRMGAAMPYVHNATKALGDVSPWAFLFKWGVVMQLRVIGNFDPNEVSDASALYCPEESLTHQEFAEESDINVIIDRFGIGENPIEAMQWVTDVDIADAPNDYQSVMNQLNEARDQFMSLPAKVRSRFDNDPGNFVAFVSDPSNQDEMISLGLATRRPEPDPAPVSAPAQLSS